MGNGGGWGGGARLLSSVSIASFRVGKFITSQANNLVPGQKNASLDISMKSFCLTNESFSRYHKYNKSHFLTSDNPE
jgi:hypothetical protein